MARRWPAWGTPSRAAGSPTTVHPGRQHQQRPHRPRGARRPREGLGSVLAPRPAQDRKDRTASRPRPNHRRPRTPEPVRPDTSGQHPIALTRYDPVSQTFGFILEAATATAAWHAITLNALEREARTREVQRESRVLPKTLTAGVTARPSPPAKCKPSPACGPSSASTAQPSTPAPHEHSGSSRHSPPSTEPLTTSLSWNNALQRRDLTWGAKGRLRASNSPGFSAT